MTAPVSNLRQSFLDQRAVMEVRHADLFATDWRRRITVACVIGALLGLYVYALIDFEFSPSRIAGGMWRLVDITSLMLPPHPRSWGRFWLFLDALRPNLL